MNPDKVKRKITFAFEGGTEEEISKVAATVAVLLTKRVIQLSPEVTWSVTMTGEDKTH